MLEEIFLKECQEVISKFQHLFLIDGTLPIDFFEFIFNFDINHQNNTFFKSDSYYMSLFIYPNYLSIPRYKYNFDKDLNRTKIIEVSPYIFNAMPLEARFDYSRTSKDSLLHLYNFLIEGILFLFKEFLVKNNMIKENEVFEIFRELNMLFRNTASYQSILPIKILKDE